MERPGLTLSHIGKEVRAAFAPQAVDELVLTSTNYSDGIKLEILAPKIVRHPYTLYISRITLECVDEMVLLNNITTDAIRYFRTRPSKPLTSNITLGEN